MATAGTPKEISLADRIDALLPQTQCRRCTFAGCRPYAEAIAQGAADINQCPPGGERTANALGALAGLSQHAQVILLSHHRQLAEIAKTLPADTVNLCQLAA